MKPRRSKMNIPVKSYAGKVSSNKIACQTPSLGSLAYRRCPAITSNNPKNPAPAHPTDLRPITASRSPAPPSALHIQLQSIAIPNEPAFYLRKIAFSTPSGPQPVAAQIKGLPSPTPLAPRHTALRMSVPRRIPPSMKMEKSGCLSVSGAFWFTSRRVSKGAFALSVFSAGNGGTWGLWITH